MKVVLDTNVLMSAIFFGGPPFQIVKAWLDGKVEMVVSVEILDEYESVCQRLKTKYPNIDYESIETILHLLIRNCELVETKTCRVEVSKDPDDNKFIECALCANVQIIVSGDKHLLDISGYKGISVLKPQDFINQNLH